MKIKIAVAALLAGCSVGMVAPTAQAGKAVPTASCSYTLNSSTGDFSIGGTFSDIAYRTIIGGQAIVGNYGYQLSFTKETRTSGTFSASGVAYADPPTFVVEFFHTRGQRMTITCTPGSS